MPMRSAAGCSRVAHFVRRDQPRAQHRVAIERLAEAPVLRPADDHVQSDRIAGDVVKNVMFRNIRSASTDYDAQFDLMVGSPFREFDRHSLGRTNERGYSFQKQPLLLDRTPDSE